jgi:GLPGLI family protein
MAQLQKQFQKTYTLYFTKTESTFKQNEELAAPQPQNNTGIVIQVTGNGGGTDILYKNIAEKRFANKTEISGKRFLIKDQLEDYGWKLTGETKNIGIYTCYKATRSKEIKNIKYLLEDGKDKKTKEMITRETIAWYAPSIAVSNGPRKYWGLPGLILEIHEGKETIVCTEIILNPSEKMTIEEPSKGKKVTQEKFDDIMDTHSKEMMKRLKNRRKSKDGESITIEIQG